MARKKIDDKMVAEWILLRGKGRSYRSIGLQYDVDPRTVKSRVEKASEEYEKEHWERVSQQVDAKYLDEHYRMLIQMTSAVMEMISLNPMNTIQKQLAPSYFDICLEPATHKATQFLAARSLDIASINEIEDSQASRLGHKLFDALMEHEPSLKTNIDAWKSDWAKFQKTRFDLIEEAKNLFKHFNIADTMAERIKKQIVNEVLRYKLLGEEPCSSSVDTSDKDNERIQNRSSRSKPVRLVRYNKRIKTTVYKGSAEEVAAACKVYDQVLLQLCHDERIGPVQDSYSSLMEHVKVVENYVDRLLLMGKPQDQCSLCLNRQKRLPLSEKQATQRSDE